MSLASPLAAADPGVTAPGRGRLTLYVGCAPGVGKTSRLLADAHELKRRGVDVALAWLDPRGRPATEALAAGLPTIPPRRVAYRGVEALDLDFEAVLARRPAVAIVDDVAHSNPPGSAHARRFQDVLALLDAGIDVLGAFDVLQLESLNDLIERLSGLRVHDTIPDTFLKGAERAVALDLAEDELLDRLRAGRIYPAARVPWALEHAFRRECLAALRELTLREVAETLGRRGPLAPAAPPQVAGRVMVCLSSLSPRALALLRRGSRLAGRLATDWFVVYVETPEESPGRIRPDVQRTLVANVETARELGAEVVRLRSRDPVAALLDFARSHGVATLLAGRSGRPWWKRLLHRTPVDRLFDEALDLDVYVVAEEDETEEQ